MNTYPNIDISLESYYEFQTDLRYIDWPSGDGGSHSNWADDKKLYHVIYPILTTAERNQIQDFYDDNKSELFIFQFKDYDNTTYSGCAFLKQPEFIYITEEKYEGKISIMEI